MHQQLNADGEHYLSRRVLCIETGETFNSINLAAESLNLHSTAIQACCAGKNKSTGGLHFKYAKRAKRIKKRININTKFTYQYQGGIKVRVYREE